eukprot:3941948-Rhodomonas_salina.1
MHPLLATLPAKTYRHRGVRITNKNTHTKAICIGLICRKATPGSKRGAKKDIKSARTVPDLVLAVVQLEIRRLVPLLVPRYRTSVPDIS